MSDTGAIVNKVAKSGLITLDIEKLFRPTTRIIGLDIKPFLFMELLLKEKDFREAVESHDFTQYAGCILALHCSSDAIVPEWAWMLLASKAAGIVSEVHFGTIESVREWKMLVSADKHDWSQYNGKKVLVKGCGDEPIPSSLYVYVTNQLMSSASRVMYGEACSFVPVWRQS